MLTIAPEVANLRVSPPRQRFEGELTGDATTVPEARQRLSLCTICDSTVYPFSVG